MIGGKVGRQHSVMNAFLWGNPIGQPTYLAVTFIRSPR